MNIGVLAPPKKQLTRITERTAQLQLKNGKKKILCSGHYIIRLKTRNRLQIDEDKDIKQGARIRKCIQLVLSQPCSAKQKSA